MALTQYFVERLIAHRDVWMIKFDEEEYGPTRVNLKQCSLRSTPPSGLGRVDKPIDARIAN